MAIGAFRLLFVFASERLGIKASQICIEQIDATLVLGFLAHIEDQRGNCAATRNGRLAAVKAFIRCSGSCSIGSNPTAECVAAHPGRVESF